MDRILQDINLLKKYDVEAFHYADYPHKKFWSDAVGDAEYRDALKRFYGGPRDSSVLLYFHIPFCEEICNFCICSKTRTKDYDRVNDYLQNILFREIDMFAQFVRDNDLTLKVEEIFMGGGSPTFMREPEFDQFIEHLAPIVDVSGLKDFCIEIDPRRVDVERMRFYHSRHVNKISIGIQDFDHAVQVEANRIQPPELVEALLTPEIREYFPSINFDVLIGLPKQTRESIRAPIERLVEMSPDRVTLAYMHYSPAYRPNMRQLVRNAPLPDFYRRKELFVEALGILLDAGYVRTGFENFAKPTDPLGRAFLEKTASFSSLGAITGGCQDVIAFGSSGHGNIGPDFSVQNHYGIEECRDALDRGQFPIFRGIDLDDDDKIRGDLIRNLRTYFQVDYAEFGARHGIDFTSYFANELNNMGEFVADGLVTMTATGLEMTEIGQHFANIIASVFDRYVDGPWYNEEIYMRKSG